MARRLANFTTFISSPQNLRNDTPGHQCHFGPDEAGTRRTSAAVAG
jgi:hypothetical protein